MHAPEARSCVILFLVVFNILAVAPAASSTLTPQKETILSGGKPRTYYTLVPEKIVAPVPLLLLLHGSGRDGMSQIDAWKDLAEWVAAAQLEPEQIEELEVEF